MELTFAPRGILQIDDARIIFRNFKGTPSAYNREGNRNFALVIPTEEIADALVKDGWNVKIKDAREEGEPPLMHLPVKLNFNGRGPSIYLVTGDKANKLDEETVGILDDIDILSVNMNVRAYDWVTQEGTKNEKRGRSAYLQSIEVFQDIDRISAKYAEEEFPEE